MTQTPARPIRPLDSHPLMNVTWVNVAELQANDYNPNVVVTPELKLLKFSLLKQGWIQPVLVARDEDGRLTIIDGFHRSHLTRTDKEVSAMTGGRVPCAILDLDLAQRKLLTVRINRAKGSHVAARMHDLVTSLVKDHAMSVERICEEIGASRHEVDTLMLEDVFQRYDSANHQYSKAWEPKANTN